MFKLIPVAVYLTPRGRGPLWRRGCDLGCSPPGIVRPRIRGGYHDSAEELGEGSVNLLKGRGYAAFLFPT